MLIFLKIQLEPNKFNKLPYIISLSYEITYFLIISNWRYWSNIIILYISYLNKIYYLKLESSTKCILKVQLNLVDIAVCVTYVYSICPLDLMKYPSTFSIDLYLLIS